MFRGQGMQALGTAHPHHSHFSPRPQRAPHSSWGSLQGIHDKVNTHLPDYGFILLLRGPKACDFQACARGRAPAAPAQMPL